MARIDIDSLHQSPTDAVNMDDLRILASLVNDALARIERLERRFNALVDALIEHSGRRIQG